MTEEGVIIVDVRDISDVEKDVYKVMRKINIIASLLCVGERVAVRCIAGMNRSCAVALGVICYMGAKEGDVDKTWDHHYKNIKEKVPRMMITPELERTIKTALHQLDGRYRKHCIICGATDTLYECSECKRIICHRELASNNPNLCSGCFEKYRKV